MSNRVAKLIMVTAENNNKFYNMTEENGTIMIEYGRVGASNPSRTSKPSSHWDKIYREKTKKGYVDQTEILTVKNESIISTVKRKFTEFFTHRKNSVKEIVTTLQGWAKGSIQQNYTVESKDVTQAQVDKAQAAITEMQLHDLGTDVLQAKTDLNKMLLAYFTIVPRKMKHVKDNLFNASTISELETQRAEKLQVEQDTLDVMAGQVALDTATNQTVEDEDQAEVLTDIIESSGLTFEEVDDKSIIDLIKDKMGPNAHQFKQAFEVRHLKNQEQYNNRITGAKNKLTDLLWHGSRNENWWSIITTCLQIRPTNAVHTGSMFGDGIYFANKFQKSFGYTSGRSSYFAKGNSNTAVLALYEVHQGEQKHIKHHNSSCYSLSHSVLSKEGFDSVYAHGGADLRNDEFIVYQGNQCTMKYLVIVNA
jgi:poly [ADP-ribose] polymerase